MSGERKLTWWYPPLCTLAAVVVGVAILFAAGMWLGSGAENDAIISRCQQLAAERKQPDIPCGRTSGQLAAEAKVKRDRELATKREKAALAKLTGAANDD